VKKAMVALDAAGHFLQLQVHDELDSSVADIKEAKKMANVMQLIIPAKVPFRVDVETGPSWGELKKAA
jgi:DNA polymerase I-like protein with 3'-5' exonuclease and polymerase domains